MGQHFSESVDFGDITTLINRELKRLGWTPTQEKNYLVKTYRQIILKLLTDEQLLDFFEYLQNLGNEQTKGNKTMTSPIQKIFFGCPGTGKSHKISNDIDGGIVKQILGIDKNIHPENLIKTVFHPEYTYGDFMGKLMPQTKSNGDVYYQFYQGHFLQALAQAYKNLLVQKEDETVQNVALVIDEINRGNSSAIFGTVFQLLDRRQDGWSAYEISLSDLEFQTLIKLTGFKEVGFNNVEKVPTYTYGKHTSERKLGEYQDILDKIQIKVEKSTSVVSSIRIPYNLSIFGTMNTSDNSIYFMDNAFKRRWEWEYVDWNEDDDKKLDNVTLEGYGDGTLKWKNLVERFNIFIKDNHNSVRSGRIEDMQIGYRFINAGTITEDQIKNKLMFFIWDSVFNRDKTPIRKLLNKSDKELVTFGDFIKYHQEFVTNLLKYTTK
ncbi:restriction endonuclease [Okeanomitos corallinicola TIOX110]|uniref:Restriction endonuclease n=1 Tax=Okeanomitos corallinicola TIOX110 TaxID=3133117 RepID=A0ABZ2URL5_9CYAN